MALSPTQKTHIDRTSSTGGKINTTGLPSPTKQEIDTRVNKPFGR